MALPALPLPPAPSFVAAFLTLPVLLAPARGGEERSWPQWLGPTNDGISTESAWSSTGKEADVWRAEVGLGYSSVAIQGGRLYTKGFDKDAGMDVVWCLDPKTGEELWAFPYPAEIWDRFHAGGTLSTPTLDGDAVYTLDREGKAHCLDALKGEVRWEKNLRAEHDLEVPTWGFSASPVVVKDVLLLNVGTILALDKATGKQLWKTKNYGHAYSTPVVCTLRGRPALAVINGEGLILLDLEGGKELATHPWKTQYDINASTPLVAGDKFFISSGYNHGCALLQLADDGLKVLWESKAMRTQMAGCVLIEDNLYGFDDRILKCVGLDGAEKWEVRGIGNGALIGAAGRLIVVGASGELIVAKASPAAYEELSRQKILDGGVYWTTPVLLDGYIYCRNNLGTLVCRDHRP